MRPTNLPLHPLQPERLCWGCNRYCPAFARRCAGETARTPHPIEVLGEDWYKQADWNLDRRVESEPGPADALAPDQ